MRLRVEPRPSDPEPHALQGLPRPAECKTSNLHPLRPPDGGTQTTRKGPPAPTPLFETHLVCKDVVLFVTQPIGKRQQLLQPVSRSRCRQESPLCMSATFRWQAVPRWFVTVSRVYPRHLLPEE